MRYRQNNVRKKLIPAYGIVPLLLAVLWNSLAYNGARWIASGRYHYNIETVLDERIPFIPWTLVIYFGCYLFWGINYILIARQEKESVYRFFTADAYFGTGRRAQVSFFYSGYLFQTGLSGDICGISDDQYQTGDCGRRILESGRDLALFH